MRKEDPGSLVICTNTDFSREEKNEILIRKLGERMNKFQEVMDVERKVNSPLRGY